MFDLVDYAKIMKKCLKNFDISTKYPRNSWRDNITSESACYLLRIVQWNPELVIGYFTNIWWTKKKQKKKKKEEVKRVVNSRIIQTSLLIQSSF